MRKSIKHNTKAVKDNSLRANALNVPFLPSVSSSMFLSSPLFSTSLPYFVFSPFFFLLCVKKYSPKVHAPGCIFRANWKGITEIYTVETCFIQKFQSLLESQGMKSIV